MNFRITFRMSKFIFFLFTTTILVCCDNSVTAKTDGKHSENQECEFVIEQKLTRETMLAVKTAECEDMTLHVNLSDGTPLRVGVFSWYIQKFNTTVVVDKYCIGTCADILLPAAAEIKFVDSPLIGFGSNPYLVRELANEYRPSGYLNCNFQNYALMDKIYKRSSAKIEFGYKRLGQLKVKQFLVSPQEDPKGCPEMQIEFEHNYWFPNSETLKVDFGINFSGKVCADKNSCAYKTFKKYASDGSYVINDRAYSFEKGKIHRLK